MSEPPLPRSRDSTAGERPSPPADGAGSDERVPAPPAHLVLGVALGGLALGPLILGVDLPAWDSADKEVARSGAFQLWATAIAVQTMSWAFAFPLIRGIARRSARESAPPKRELTVGTALLVLCGLAVAFTPRLVGDLPDVVPHRWAKVTLITLVAFALAIYAARMVWRTGASLRALADEGRADLDAIREHRRLRADLQILLAILGTLITSAVIASAALRTLTVSADPVDAIPAESVIVYGLLLSLLLALVFLPAYLALLRSGQTLRDAMAPLVAPDHSGFSDRIEKREQLGKLLGLDVAATTTFRAAVAILGPLLGSLTSLLPDLGG